MKKKILLEITQNKLNKFGRIIISEKCLFSSNISLYNFIEPTKTKCNQAYTPTFNRAVPNHCMSCYNLSNLPLKNNSFLHSPQMLSLF